jgi:DNA-binding XRE family transcriptional regulator
MYISNNIKYLRLKSGHNQNELGRALGKTGNAIAAYENGKNTPPIEACIKICELYKVGLNDLVFEDLSQAEGKGKGLTDASAENQKRDELLVKLMAMKFVELAVLLKETSPDVYEKMKIDSVVDTVRDLIL